MFPTGNPLIGQSKTAYVFFVCSLKQIQAMWWFPFSSHRYSGSIEAPGVSSFMKRVPGPGELRKADGSKMKGYNQLQPVKHAIMGQ